ncbi:DUF554 domain-containing protein [Collinsella tanakaei]|uniref:DUF554 domain-containing protein n=1 Tax=Collinsella tanakaei TaxID=626935 RepID=UPI00195A1121|nr:DUF554 domain-containing protein [Collinsella tanakaei]MBM6779593.1 DUF554 domain-containing protein [Collinsella tanakaei]
MIGLGTLINVACILAGGIFGLLGGRFLVPRVQETLMKATGLCVIFVGLSGTLEEMLAIQDGALATGGTAMMIVSFALGSAIGEFIDLDDRFEQLGVWLKQKTGSTDDASFVNGFVNTSLTVSIGAMAIVGSIQDGIAGDWTTLALKGALDAIIVCVMSASFGRGCLFSALPVAAIQGSITLLAQPIRPIMTAAALSNLSLVGSMLIFCVGVNLIWKGTFKPANMLPAVVVAVIWALIAP